MDQLHSGQRRFDIVLYVHDFEIGDIHLCFSGNGFDLIFVAYKDCIRDFAVLCSSDRFQDSRVLSHSHGYLLHFKCGYFGYQFVKRFAHLSHLL